jgi:uncharacterized protein (TIGR02246 family)
LPWTKVHWPSPALLPIFIGEPISAAVDAANSWQQPAGGGHVIGDTTVRHLGSCIFFGAALLLAPVAALGQGGDKKEEDALMKKAQAFVAAFDKGDAKTLAGFWTPDGIYRDQKDTETKGRAAIEKMFAAFFKQNKGLKLRINIEGMRTVSNDVIIEEGTTEVLHPDGSPPSVARYVIVHVKKNGDWYIDIVKDHVYIAPTNYKQLHDLQWVIGDWADEVEKGNVGRLSFSWGPNQNYIIGTVATTFKNIAISNGTQWITWDPKAKQIRSWLFDESGSFAEATWTHKGDKFFIKATTTLKDGKTLTATNIITRLDADTVTWQSINRAIDGKAIPDIKELKMKRVK